VKKYWLVFTNTLLTRLEYRSDLLGTVIMDLIPVVGAVWLWTAVFKTASNISGFTSFDTMGYFVLLPLVGFISRCDLSRDFGYQIRKGEFSNYLVKPVSARKYMLAHSLGRKIGYLILVLPVYFLFLYLLSRYSINFNITLTALTTGIILSIISFILQFIMETSIVNMAFWMDEVWSLVHFKNILISVLGGGDFPLNFLPLTLFNIFMLLPFGLFYYLPAMSIIGKLPASNLFGTYWPVYLFWFVMLLVLSQLTWKTGVKKYGAFGN
jgi:ABC-2 type transport system permease protein